MNGPRATSPVFCAIDVPDIGRARTLAQDLRGLVRLKLGLENFTSLGPEGFRAVTAGLDPAFLDLKLHDIPNTVARAVNALLPLKPGFLTIHASGGPAMMRAVAQAALQAGQDAPKLLAVTVLTSLDAGDLAAVGQAGTVAEQVLRLARLAQACGIDGVVCAPTEIASLRAALGPDFLLVTPGIRPAWALGAGDQKRVMTPKEALSAGANYLVIGRPITDAADPKDAAQRILAEIA